MGRPSLPDEEKIRRGTYREDTSEAARARSAAAKVLKFPVLREMPEPRFSLGQVGRKTFDFWARKLLEAGLLTEISLAHVEGLAIADEQIEARISQGREVSNSSLLARSKYLQHLEALNVDTSFHANQAKKSEFASHGFPNRLRTPAEHRARVAEGGRRGD